MTRCVCVFGMLLMFVANASMARQFCNTAVIPIPGSGTSGPAGTYPSTMTVSGMPGTIDQAIVSFNNLSHDYPRDLDMLLVGPGGQSMVIASDVGGGDPVGGLSFVLADSAPRPLSPDTIAMARYRPTDRDASGAFPAPAPAGPHASAAPVGAATFASVFGGTDANGTWSLYILDDTDGDAGQLAGGWCIQFSDSPLRISEFRVRGPMYEEDEFIELQNVSAVPYVVQAYDGTSGMAVVASDGITRCTLPNGITFAPYQHYLCTGPLYSLFNYASADQNYAVALPDNAGLALFATTAPIEFGFRNRVDAVGPTSVVPLFREGAGLVPLAAIAVEYAWVRDQCGKQGRIADRGSCGLAGRTADTDDNAGDFIYVETGSVDIGAGSRLGSPGPQSTTSPTFGSGDIRPTLLDACASDRSAPNVVHDVYPAPTPDGVLGIVSARRTFTNRTGAPLTRLRLRVVDISTTPAPAGTADLQMRISSAITETVNRAPCATGTSEVTVWGTTPEELSWWSSIGDGFNGSFAATALGNGALADNASIDLNFVFDVRQAGRYRVALAPEGLPKGGGFDDLIRIEGCFPVNCTDDVFADDFEIE